MTSKLKKWLCGGVLLGAVAISLPNWAMGPPEGMARDPVRMLGHMSRYLDLSVEQQSEVQSLLDSAQESTAADHQRMRELRTRLMSMRADFDAAQAQQIADEIGQLTGAMVYQASATLSQVYRLLDAEQRAQLDELMAQRGKDRGRPHRGGEVDQ